MRRAAAGLLALLAACTNVPSPEAALDERVPGILAGERIPGAVVLVGESDRVVYRRAFGSATPETIFDLASCTKVVGTTTAAMMLVERGTLSLDDRLGKFIPCFEGRDITVRQLLLHRARLPAYHTAKSSTPDDILVEFSKLPPTNKEFTYS